jgi:hypothetical protein
MVHGFKPGIKLVQIHGFKPWFIARYHCIKPLFENYCIFQQFIVSNQESEA